ncbi:agamous-like MADS-box protein AGL80 isoform X1 [Prunus yedoensis var. nudiflora]|uniref:Agamous-like MADS-box protein AGL80 isoform X1 n=1 Tax=Prunus yedoensis var. nudiflora TaxID=2094558 RepID=A0A314UKA9_PRUYE|nr:agamous-like MADS-box protein AGL80 isoform X1 [Prunus yedoensis var. nudiflora]
MTKKVSLTYITNDSARKATFKKRKKGLMKKANELSTLCDIQACVIIYSQYESHPEVWPSPLGVQHIVSQFRSLPEMDQSKKMVNQETFLRQRIVKAKEQLKKLRKENREKEMSRVMFQTDCPVPPTPAAVPAAGDHALNLNMQATMERQAFGLSNMGNTMQRPSWFTDMMNPNEQMGFGAVAEVLPFGDQYHHGLWSNNPFFP